MPFLPVSHVLASTARVHEHCLTDFALDVISPASAWLTCSKPRCIFLCKLNIFPFLLFILRYISLIQVLTSVNDNLIVK